MFKNARMHLNPVEPAARAWLVSQPG
jgi:hypothetical protein